jgi:hypothetical protein
MSSTDTSALAVEASRRNSESMLTKLPSAFAFECDLGVAGQRAHRLVDGFGCNVRGVAAFEYGVHCSLAFEHGIVLTTLLSVSSVTGATSCMISSASSTLIPRLSGFSSAVRFSDTLRSGA